MSCDEKWTCEKWSCDELWWAVELWWVRYEKWSCDELVCDKLWWVVMSCCDVCCACHAKGSRGPSGAHARRSSSRKLCALRLPRKRQPRPQRRPRAPQLLQEALCTAPAMQKAAAAPAAPTRAAAPPHGLCVLRLPCERQPRPQRRPRAPQLLQEALCAAPATQKAATAPAAPTRAAAPPGGSVYCACHAKGSRGAHARRSSSRRLCVLRRPRQRQPGSYLYSEWMSEWGARRRRTEESGGIQAKNKNPTQWCGEQMTGVEFHGTSNNICLIHAATMLQLSPNNSNNITVHGRLLEYIGVHDAGLVSTTASWHPQIISNPTCSERFTPRPSIWLMGQHEISLSSGLREPLVLPAAEPDCSCATWRIDFTSVEILWNYHLSLQYKSSTQRTQTQALWFFYMASKLNHPDLNLVTRQVYDLCT